MEAKGDKEDIILAIDGVNLYSSKKKKLTPSPSKKYIKIFIA